jgi:CBS domain-containing protein
MYEARNSEARPWKRWPMAIAAGLLGAALLCQPGSAYAFPLGGGFHGGGGFGHGGAAGGYGGWGHGGWAGGYGHGYGGYGYGYGYPSSGWAVGVGVPAYGYYSYSPYYCYIILTHAAPRSRAASGVLSLAAAPTPAMAAGPAVAGAMAAGPAVAGVTAADLAGSTPVVSTAAEPASDRFRLPSAASRKRPGGQIPISQETRSSSMNACDVMTTKVVAVGPDTSTNKIAERLPENRISAVPVVDGTGAPIAIVSEGDLIGREEAARDDWWLALLADGAELNADHLASLRASAAREITGAPVATVSEETDISEIARLLAAYRFKRVPVVREAASSASSAARTCCVGSLREGPNPRRRQRPAPMSCPVWRLLTTRRSWLSRLSGEVA